MSEICAHVLYEQGEAAAQSVRAKRNNESVEKVVEANTLLSGLGFESGGLALAHALALSYTQIAAVHDNYMHGEMVAMGLMAQLAMEQSDDVQRVARFFARVGLPVRLEQLSLSLQHHSELDTLIEATMAKPIAHHMPMPVTPDSLRQAILGAHDTGRRIAEEVGDKAYRRLQD
jgi:glycerol dehydrogenase